MKLSLSLMACSLAALSAAQVDPSLFSQLKWRLVGPYRGGRCVAVAGSVARPKEFYFGATGGGLWKTTDAGEHWSCVSDGFFHTASVGAVAISASNPDIVYAGMGERDIRGDISYGDGVYKSTDGGKTWKHLGLEDTQNISKIQVDPKDPNTIYAAALGHVYGPNQARGVYKSTDGGTTWSKILFVSDKAGAVDLAMDPSDAKTLYASTWEAWRTPYTLNSGGPGSKLFKTTDGGATWTDLSGNPGMPKGVLGKICIAIAQSNPKIVYASVEAADGGLFRSDDGGATWTHTSSDHGIRQRAWYFSHIAVDPKNPDIVYDLNVGVEKSTDGGKTFRGMRVSHSDNHDLWIAPDDPKRMIESNDGGAVITLDGGQNWSSEEVPTGEFYHVTADNDFPYHLLGAQQDSSSVRIASRTEHGGISRTDWSGTAGGESGYVTAKPDDPNVVFGGNYNGEIGMMNHATGQYRDVNPWPDNPMGWAAKDLKERFQWTFPIVFSPNNPNLLYVSSQYLYRTNNGGDSWVRISPDLTRNDPSTLGSSGGPITKDNTSVEYYGTIFTVAESPGHPGVIWTGSDDGLVSVTHDGGDHWQNVTPSDAPKWSKISMVEASPHSVDTAYLAVDNHTNDDLAPYAYRTHDGGKTWTKIVDGVPNGAFVRSVREDPKRPGLLYMATETGVYVSFSDGDHWQPLRLNLPECPVHDLMVKDNDLLAATHGRAFWILDNIEPLREAGSLPAKPYLFQPSDAYRVSWGGFRFGFGRQAGPEGQNPPSGVVIDYYLPQEAKSAKLEFLDDKGQVLMAVNTLDKDKGAHRGAYRLTVPGYRTFEGMEFWNGGASPIPLPPGTYEALLTVDGQSQSKKFRLLRDPRNPSTDRDLQEQYNLSIRIRDRETQANNAVIVTRDLMKKIGEAETASKQDPAVVSAGDALKAKLQAVESAINQDQIKAGEDPLNYPIMLNDKLSGLLGNVQSGSFRPTKQAYEVFDELSKQLQPYLDALGKTTSDDLPKFNDLLKSKGVAPISPIDPAKAAPAQQRRFGGDGDSN